MPDKIYVPSAIFIDTAYFIPANEIGAFFSSPPKGAIIMNTQGVPFITITEKNAPSFFNSYYSSGDIMAYSGAHAVFFDNDPKLIIDEFNSRISDVLSLVEYCKPNDKISKFANRLGFLSSVAALDTFISNVILFKATKDISAFSRLVELLPKGKITFPIKKQLKQMWKNNQWGDAEQKIIDATLDIPFSNLNKIKKYIKGIYSIEIEDNKSIEDIIKNRHIIAHKNGRSKDGKLIEFSYDEILLRISEIKKFVYNIFRLLNL